MSEEEQQSQAGDASATPTRQPEPYWRSRADTAAKIPNPMYASNAGTTPQPQSLRSRADDAAKIPNPMYASNAGATRMRQPLSYWRSLANAAAKMFNPMYAFISSDGAHPGGASGRRGVCSFLRAHRSCLAAGIAVLLSLIAVGLAPLTFSNKQEISQLSTTVKRDQDDIRHLSATVDALKRGQDALKSYQDDMRQLSAAVNALKREQDGIPTAVDDLKRDLDNLSTTVKRDQDDIRHLSATVDALKRGQDALKGYQDDMRQLSAAVNALKREQDGIPTAVDDLKRDLDNERSRIATLDQRLHVIEKTLPSCPEGYTIWRGICYKAFDARKSFSEAGATCRADGGTLAMPRDADTNAFLFSLYMSVNVRFAYWIGLHDQTEEGKFEWVDGSALGPYNSWGQGEPEKYGADEDCVAYSRKNYRRDKWIDAPCHYQHNFVCQAVPGTYHIRIIS
ncbi:PREDICTED: CD209 antigen-like [Branchiostoma belcheri]|uniref:CD209 antigen-like n=1 Tax=Branchiostoma belcheri TaxID=7741 RepID=A0A6P4YIZ8_BRABE|nr:PREDICTED: CD209 antigen-like [Branchiostoma belcheri]